MERLFLQSLQHCPVGPVEEGLVEGGQVDFSSHFRIVPHTFADDGKRYMSFVGDGGPAVPGDVRRKTLMQTQEMRQFFEQAVVIREGIPVLFESS